MSYEWGQSVATLPVTNGTIRHIHRTTETLRITADRSVLTHMLNARHQVHAHELKRTVRHLPPRSMLLLISLMLLCACRMLELDAGSR
eukprot:327310-Pleurochrysis_carterae.AAC.4